MEGRRAWLPGRTSDFGIPLPDFVVLAVYEIHNRRSLMTQSKEKLATIYGGPVMRGVSGECRDLQLCCNGNNLHIVLEYEQLARDAAIVMPRCLDVSHPGSVGILIRRRPSFDLSVIHHALCSSRSAE